MFTTEGHILPIGSKLRTKIWDDETSNPSFDSNIGSYYNSDLVVLQNTLKPNYIQLKGNNITQPSVSKTHFILYLLYNSFPGFNDNLRWI